MELELFDYDLPADRIAQRPAAERTAARLCRLDRATGAVAHHRVADLPALLRRGDLLVLNRTAVVPARLSLRRKSGGRVGGLFLRQGDDGRWVLLLNSRGRLKEGEELLTSRVWLTLRLERRLDGGQWEAAVQCTAPGHTTMDLLEAVGQTPLPPYIRREADTPADRQRYQTVFAREPGAVAAPTAGLHFSAELLDALAAGGVETAFVTLHVGLGTFEPVRTPRVEDHAMHAEWFDCPRQTADAANAARAAGRRVVAVGTTSVRVLESCVEASGSGRIVPRCGWTDLFIYPGRRFGAVDAMLTNFHLPRSSLLVLVCAFAGRERILSAYAEAIREGYRFYSYGDAMLIE